MPLRFPVAELGAYPTTLDRFIFVVVPDLREVVPTKLLLYLAAGGVTLLLVACDEAYLNGCCSLDT